MTSLAELGERRATFRGSFRVISKIAWLFAIILGIAIVFRYWRVGDVNDALETAENALLYWLGFVAILLALAKLHVTHIHEFGLVGRNYWSLPVKLKWTDIQSWRLDRANGVSAVVLTERHSNREMWIFRDVFFSKRFQQEIRRFPDIPIPERF